MLSIICCTLEGIDIVQSSLYSLYLIPKLPYLSLHFASVELEAQRIEVTGPDYIARSSQAKLTVSVAHIQSQGSNQEMREDERYLHMSPKKGINGHIINRQRA